MSGEPPDRTVDGGSEEKGHDQSMTSIALSGVSWTVVGTAVQAVLQTAVLMILARVLSPSEFGRMSMAVVVIAFAQIFSRFGIRHAMIQRPSLTEAHVRTGTTLVSVFGVLMAAVVAMSAPGIAAFYETPSVEPIVFVLSAILIIDGISALASSLAERALRFRALAIVDLASYAVGGSTAVGMALAGFGIWALVGAYFAQETARAVMLVIAVPERLRFGIEMRAFKDLTSYGSGFTSERLAAYLAHNGDTLIVGRNLGAAVLGIYDKAYQLMAIPASFFGSAAEKVLFAVTTRVQDDSRRLGIGYRRAQVLIAWILLPSSLVLFVVAPELISLLLGEQWNAAVAPFRILVMAMFFRTGLKVGSTVARAQGDVYPLAWRRGIYAACVFVGATVASPFGLIAVAAAVGSSIVIHFALIAHLNVKRGLLTSTELLQLHVPATMGSAGAGGASWAIAWGARSIDAPDPIVLFGAGSAAALVILLIARFAPQRFLGAEGEWWLGTTCGILSSMPSPKSLLRK